MPLGGEGIIKLLYILFRSVPRCHCRLLHRTRSPSASSARVSCQCESALDGALSALQPRAVVRPPALAVWMARAIRTIAHVPTTQSPLNPRQPPACPRPRVSARRPRAPHCAWASCHIFGGADIGARSGPPAGSRAIQSHTSPAASAGGGASFLPRAAVHALPLPAARAHARAHACLAPRAALSPPSVPATALQTTSLAPLRSFEAACRRLQAPAGLVRPLALPVAPRCVACNGARTRAHGLPVSPKIQTLLVNPDMACLPTRRMDLEPSSGRGLALAGARIARARAPS